MFRPAYPSFSCSALCSRGRSTRGVGTDWAIGSVQMGRGVEEKEERREAGRGGKGGLGRHDGERERDDDDGGKGRTRKGEGKERERGKGGGREVLASAFYPCERARDFKTQTTYRHTRTRDTQSEVSRLPLSPSGPSPTRPRPTMYTRRKRRGRPRGGGGAAYLSLNSARSEMWSLCVRARARGSTHGQPSSTQVEREREEARRTSGSGRWGTRLSTRGTGCRARRGGPGRRATGPCTTRSRWCLSR